jgi:hypothetical protein
MHHPAECAAAAQPLLHFIHHFFSRSSIPSRKNSEENFNKLPSAVSFLPARFGGIINCHRESVRKSDIFALSQIALGKTVCAASGAALMPFFHFWDQIAAT